MCCIPRVQGGQCAEHSGSRSAPLHLAPALHALIGGTWGWLDVIPRMAFLRAERMCFTSRSVSRKLDVSLLIFDEYYSIRRLPFLVMAFGHFCGSSPALWTLTVTIHNLHLPVHLNEQFLCQHPGERLCRTEHRASMSLSTQQRTRLTISRLTPNSGVYCWGSSKCLMTLGRKRSFHGVQLERALVAVATGRLNITAATGCSEQGGLGAACCPRGPLCSAAEVGSNGKCSPGCLCTPPCMLLGFTGESR